MARLEAASCRAAIGVSLMPISPFDAQPSAEISKMDIDKNGIVMRAEFLTSMISVFDKHAGAKGYCTAEEA